MVVVNDMLGVVDDMLGMPVVIVGRWAVGE